jgi:hypothetical protein
MAYVPGYQYDIFVSYAHGDDRTWIRNFAELLTFSLKEQLGVEPKVWIDKGTLESATDFRKEIPQSVLKSALFLLLPSTLYVQSRYCVEVECAAFEATVAEKRRRFNIDEFRNQLFAFRAPILPVEENEHWQLFQGLTDYKFHDGNFRLPIVPNGEFEVEFRRLVSDMTRLLKRMRNHSTRVFLYPRDPGADIAEAHRLLKNELIDHGYRVLPESLLFLEQRMHESELAIFLLGNGYDERIRELMEAIARRQERPWVVWESPAARATSMQDQRMLLARVSDKLASPQQRYFISKIRPDQLKREVMELLKPSARIVSAPNGKRRIALVYDDRKRQELANASDIRFRWDREFEFELPGAGLPPQVTGSDGVLLVWGRADETWCSSQFQHLNGFAAIKGLCVFDPDKRVIVQRIRQSVGKAWHISEHYGQFDPNRLDPFFELLRHVTAVGRQA